MDVFSRSCRTGPGANREPTEKTGFTVVEVLVAVTVAAVLASTFIAAQRASMHMAEGTVRGWKMLNVSQEILSERRFSGLTSPSPAFINWDPDGNVRWRLSKLPAQPDLDDRVGVELPNTKLRRLRLYVLETEVDGDLDRWDWYGPK